MIYLLLFWLIFFSYNKICDYTSHGAISLTPAVCAPFFAWIFSLIEHLVVAGCRACCCCCCYPFIFVL